MKTDSEIKQEVKAELEWGSRSNSSSITIEVENGIVTLTGNVDSYPKKINAGKAAERMEGVRSVANFLEVKLPISSYRRDSDIAKSVLATIKWNSAVDENYISCKVQNGLVILEGDVEWEFQRLKAGLLAGDITGVRDVKNLIHVSSTSQGMIQKKMGFLFNRANQSYRPGFH